MKTWACLAAMFFAVSGTTAGAEDLFPKGKAQQMGQFSELPKDTTIGGYPIYDGGLTWRLIKSEASLNNLLVRFGQAYLFSPLGNDYFAEMAVTVSMGGAPESGYFSADMCSLNTPHLFMRNKATGQNDNCLLIDPFLAKVGGRDTLTLLVKIRNSQSSWRLYDLSLLLSMEKLGFSNGIPSEWSESAIANDPKKKAFLLKAIAWGTQLQDAVNNAMAFSKPQDVFAKVPTIQALMGDGNPAELAKK